MKTRGKGGKRLGLRKKKRDPAAAAASKRVEEVASKRKKVKVSFMALNKVFS